MRQQIIINADDCGMSSWVDSNIEEAIKLGKISSTTILANMNDFEGAVRLYKKYNNLISFGWHINLDEGEPLTKSQLLLDSGFFIEREGRVLMNGRAFRNKYINKRMRQEIKRELQSQWEKLKDNGIEITHADGHHYIHTQASMILIIPSLLNELGINKCRHVANYGAEGLRRIAKEICSSYYKAKGLKMTDTFCPLIDFYNNPNLKHGRTIELMCHPGHSSEEYINEYKLLLNTDFYHKWPLYKLITYKDL